MGLCQSTSPDDVSPNEQPQKTKAAASNRDLAAKNGRFSYQTGTCALEYWEPVKELGEGSISSIYLVRRRPSRVDIPYQERVDIMSLARKNGSLVQNSKDDLYALKSIIKAYIRNETFVQEMRNEIFTMSHLDHPNVVTVYEAYERKRHIYLIMEYCSGGDLTGRKFTEAQTAWAVRKILSAVAYLHKHKVVHRDLKLENIMFDKPGKDRDIKIIDFGLATRYLSDQHKKMTDRVGTLYSMAPQVLQGVYDYKCDLWSIGVITYILLSGGKKPFWGPPREMSWDQRRKIMVDRIMRCQYMKTKGPTWDKISPEAKRFVASLLQCDPSKRPTAAKALKSAWMRKHPSDEIRCCSSPRDAAYNNFVVLKRRARTQIMEQLDENEITQLKSIFEKYDKSCEGQIGVNDFRRALSESKMSKDDVASLFSDLEIDDCCTVDYIDLVSEMLESKGRRQSERMADAFSTLDVDGTGKVSKEKVKDAMQQIISEQMTDAILEEVDADKEGLVSVEQILSLADKNNVDFVNSVLGMGKAGAEEEASLVNAKNAVIPGGRIDPNDKPEYVYDGKTERLRRTEEINVCDSC